MAKETTKGTTNMKEVNEAIHTMDILMKLYKRKRMTTSDFQKKMTEQLVKMESKRDYLQYLSNIGQR